jgi:hypothetical protein
VTVMFIQCIGAADAGGRRARFGYPPIDAERPRLPARETALPEPFEMAVVGQLPCGGCLGPFPVPDISPRSPARYFDLELDQEFSISSA